MSSESGSGKSTTRSAISPGLSTITNEAGQLSMTGQTAAETIAGIEIADALQGFARKLSDEVLTESDPVKREALLDKAKKWEEGGAYRNAAAALRVTVMPATLGAAAVSAAGEMLEELQHHFTIRRRTVRVDTGA